MGSANNQDTLRGIGIPHELDTRHLWSAQASYSQQGPYPGTVEPQGDTGLLPVSSGTQSASGALRVKTQRAGRPGPNGAAFVWRNSSDSTSTWRGRDVQQMAGWEAVHWTDGTGSVNYYDPDAISLPDGSVLVAYLKQTGASSYIVGVTKRSPSAGTWSATTIYTVPSGASGDGAHPALAYDAVSGDVYLAHWVYDTTNSRANIAMYRSTDSGATWTAISQWCLDTGVDVSGTPGATSTGYECERLRMGIANGQILLVGRLIHNENDGAPTTDRDTIAQFAGTTRGGRLTTVEIANMTSISRNFGPHSVVVVGGKFHVAFVDNPPFTTASAFFWVPLPHAFASISNRVGGLFGSSSTFIFTDAAAATIFVLTTSTFSMVGDCSVWVDEDGTIYGAFREATGGAGGTKPGQTILVCSYDGGSTWNYTGGVIGGTGTSSDGTEVATIHYSSDSNDHLTNFVGCSSQGRQVLIHQWTVNAGNEDTSIGALYLGGYTTLTIPGTGPFPMDHQRKGWTHTWIPIERPDDSSAYTTTTSGGTAVLQADGELNIATAAQNYYYSRSITPAATNGIIVEGALRCNSGGSLSSTVCGIEVVVADNVLEYDLEIRLTSTGFRLYDRNAAAAIGSDETSVAPSSGIVFRIAISGGGKLSVWFRALALGPDRQWTNHTSNHQLTDGGGGVANNVIRWGHVISGTANADWLWVCYAHNDYAAGQLGDGFTNPTDLLGRTYPLQGHAVTITDGVRIHAIDGSGSEGDTYHIDTQYEYPIARVFHTESPTPRVRWRSTAVSPITNAVAEQFIPLYLNEDLASLGSEEESQGSPVLFLHCAGINWRSATWQRRDTAAGGSWQTIATIASGYTFTGQRLGASVVGAGAGTTSPYLFENECVGWYIDLSSNNIRRVVGNSAGSLAGSATGKKATLYLDGVDGTEPTGSQTMVLFPDSFTCLVALGTETASAFGLRITSQRTSTGYIEMGHLSMGRVWIPGRHQSRGRVLSYQLDTEQYESPDRFLRSVRMGPGGVLAKIAWVDPTDTSGYYGNSTDPDYRTVTDGAATTPAAGIDDVPLSLLHLARRYQDTLPVVYLPRFSRDLTSPAVFWRRHEHLLATIAGDIQIESVLGEEHSTTATRAEIFRVATLPLREVR